MMTKCLRFPGEKKQKSKMLRLSIVSDQQEKYSVFLPPFIFLSLLFAQNLQMRLMALDENLKSTLHFSLQHRDSLIFWQFSYLFSFISCDY